MKNSLYVGLSQQTALERQMDMIANNLANMNTNGYKREQPLFQQYIENAGHHTDVSFVLDKGSTYDTRAGNLTTTGAPFDLAISGTGYFQIQTANGTYYTRDGHFSLNSNGQIVTANGDPVLSTAGAPIAVTDNTQGPVVIGPDGSVSQEAAAGTIDIGQIGVETFKDPSVLRPAGGNLYDAKGAQPQPADTLHTKVEQGMLEGSNVRPVVEITKMIDVQRRYTAMQNMIQSNNDLEQSAISRLAKSRPVSV